MSLPLLARKSDLETIGATWLHQFALGCTWTLLGRRSRILCSRCCLQGCSLLLRRWILSMAHLRFSVLVGHLPDFRLWYNENVFILSRRGLLVRKRGLHLLRVGKVDVLLALVIIRLSSMLIGLRTFEALTGGGDGKEPDLLPLVCLNWLHGSHWVWFQMMLSVIAGARWHIWWHADWFCFLWPLLFDYLRLGTLWRILGSLNVIGTRSLSVDCLQRLSLRLADSWVMRRSNSLLVTRAHHNRGIGLALCELIALWLRQVFFLRLICYFQLKCSYLWALGCPITWSLDISAFWTRSLCWWLISFRFCCCSWCFQSSFRQRYWAIVGVHWGMSSSSLLDSRGDRLWWSNPLPCRSYLFHGLSDVLAIFNSRDLFLLDLLNGLNQLLLLQLDRCWLLDFAPWLHLDYLHLLTDQVVSDLYELLFLLEFLFNLCTRIDQHEVTSRLALLGVHCLFCPWAILRCLISHSLDLLIPLTLFVVYVLGVSRNAIRIGWYWFGHSQALFMVINVWIHWFLWETNRNVGTSSRGSWIKVLAMALSIWSCSVWLVQDLLHVMEFFVAQQYEILVWILCANSRVVCKSSRWILLAQGWNHHQWRGSSCLVHFSIFLKLLIWWMAEGGDLTLHFHPVRFRKPLIIIKLIDHRLCWRIIDGFQPSTATFIIVPICWTRQDAQMLGGLRICHWIINRWLGRTTMLAYLVLKGVLFAWVSIINLKAMQLLLVTKEELALHSWSLLLPCCLYLWYDLLLLVWVHLLWGKQVLLSWSLRCIFSIFGLLLLAHLCPLYVAFASSISFQDL